MTRRTTTRPAHAGNWITFYHGREAMMAAGQAALVDAAAAEVDGYPTMDTAHEWLSAMDYHIRTYGGGLAVYEAWPEIADGVAMARKALIAAAHLALGMAYAVPFASYMPLASVGHLHYHRLLSLAYAGSDRPEWRDWPAQQANQKQWKTDVMAAITAVREQWSNSDWPWQAECVVAFALGRVGETA